MHLEYPYWRIISTEHSITPDEGHSTKLSMMLVQGLFNEPHYPEITGATITEPSQFASAGINQSEIPDETEGDSGDSYDIPGRNILTDFLP